MPKPGPSRARRCWLWSPVTGSSPAAGTVWIAVSTDVDRVVPEPTIGGCGRLPAVEELDWEVLVESSIGRAHAISARCTSETQALLAEPSSGLGGRSSACVELGAAGRTGVPAPCGADPPVGPGWRFGWR